MIKDMEHHQDDKTVLLDHQGQGPDSRPLTDFAAPPRLEQLGARMIYAAQSPPAEAFNISLNALVAAAGKLLSEVVRLKRGETREDLHALKARLTTELNNFGVVASGNGAENGQISSARYVLCSVLDEAVVTTTWGGESEWSQMSLLSSFHNETFGGEKFFRMLDVLLKDPVKYLSLLELMYLCLALGFEGKYRVQPRGMLELEGIRDALYRQIRHVRGDVPRELSPHWEGLNEQRRNLVRIVPAWMVALFTVICLVVMYSGFAWVLNEQRDTVLQPYLPIDPAAVVPQSQP